MSEITPARPLDPHVELRAILTNPKAYPLEMTLADGRKLRIAHAKFIRFPPRLKTIVYFPPKVSDGLLEQIQPAHVVSTRTLRKRRAA
jgi:hypothetical protein